MKWLLVGDVHAVEEELEDCHRLLDGVEDTVKAEKPDFVLFMGDLHHNHKLVNVEVMKFWHDRLKRLAVIGSGIPVLLKGNHDMPGDGVSDSHALLSYKNIEGVVVVDKPESIGGATLIPYNHDPKAFVNDVLQHEDKVVFCHQTFDGSTYENGFYAKDGVDSKIFPDRWFISGHIHTPQKFGNVTYIGAPRWRGVSDVGIQRAIVLVELQPDKPPEILKLFNTERWCEKLVHLVDAQENPLNPDIHPGWKYIVDINGDSVYIKSRKEVWSKFGVRVRTFKTRTESRPVSESMGIGKALYSFLESYKPKYGTSYSILKQMVASRLGV